MIVRTGRVKDYPAGTIPSPNSNKIKHPPVLEDERAHLPWYHLISLGKFAQRAHFPDRVDYFSHQIVKKSGPRGNGRTRAVLFCRNRLHTPAKPTFLQHLLQATFSGGLLWGLPAYSSPFSIKIQVAYSSQEDSQDPGGFFRRYSFGLAIILFFLGRVNGVHRALPTCAIHQPPQRILSA
jgi:hypothetical protein